MNILEFDSDNHVESLAALWTNVFGYDAPRHEPNLVIKKKIAVDDMIFLAVDESQVVGSIMAGYDGHRGWIYLLAVSPNHRNKGFGTALLRHAESVLIDLGCIKINLQILEDNKRGVDFYKNNGYEKEPRISMGKILQENIPNKAPRRTEKSEK